MAPVKSKLLSKSDSPYAFSATMVATGNRPTVITCVAPSPPRRIRGAQLTITRVFKTQSTSLKHAKPSTKKQSTPGPSTVVMTSQRAATPIPGPSADMVEVPGSPLSTPPSSPSSSPPPDVQQNPRQFPAPYNKPTSGVRLTRSASRSSVKGTSKLGRRGSMANIDSRLKPDGGIITRYGEQDGEPIFIRQERVTSTTEPDVVTYFWESFTAVPLRHPPDLSSYPDLTVGDLYCNVGRGEPRGVQLWMWSIGDDGVGFWKRVREGDVREDGRRLTVTPKRQQPSWVSPTWGVKQLRNQKGR